MKFSDLKIEGSNIYISLVKLCGDRIIADIEGYLTTEFGSPVFKMSKVVFTDGTHLDCEGEHDLPYLVEYNRKQVRVLPDEETLQALYDEE
jgi:hypothetical protein